jgi:hypothetical protein
MKLAAIGILSLFMLALTGCLSAASQSNGLEAQIVKTQIGEAREYPGSYIELVDYPAPLWSVVAPIETNQQTLDSAGHDQVVTITTTQSIHVKSIRLWIGAGYGSKFETGINLEIITPGHYKRFIREWDKHVEEHYDDAPFPIDLVIPAGSVIRLSRDPHAYISCDDPPNKDCATQEMAQLYGE